MAVTSRYQTRAYAGAADLREMQAMIRRAWREHAPHVSMHVGDVTWWLNQHVKSAEELASRVRLWSDESGGTVAWAFRNSPGSLDWFFDPSLPAAEEQEIRDEMVEWLSETAEAARAAGETVTGLEIWAADWDHASIDAFARRGFELDGSKGYVHHRLPLDDALRSPSVPDDFVVRGLESDADLPGRVEAHRAAFAPSKMTEESYRQVQATDIYRRDLDVIAVSPEGRIAAFCLAWLDESSGTGLFEPVATHPDFQRQGLGRVVCLEAAHRLRDLGAHTAFITSWASNDGANRLYSSLGAEIHTHFRPYRRSLSAPAGAA